MTASTKLTLSCLMLFLLSGKPSISDFTGKSTPLISKSTTTKNDPDNKLFVFVGEKIEISPVPYTRGAFDGGVKAKYRILQRVYGHFDKDTIEFEAYSHSRRFLFTDYKTVLLYVSEHNGKLYQEKYLYDPLFKTKDGRWAGPYSSDYGHSNNEHTKVTPEKIDFAEEVSFPLKNIDAKNQAIVYPEPYFRIVGGKAIAVYGNFVPELFKLKRDGVLTSRGLFGHKKAQKNP